MEIVQQIIANLGVSQSQAEGGIGLLLKLAKEQLGTGDFGKVEQAIPEADGLIRAAPEPGGLAGALGGLTSALGGKAGDLGNLAELASSFSKLDLDAGMIGKFVPIVLSFVEQKGGADVRVLLSKVLNVG